MSESGSPGRYARSANGLVASLIITVLAVGAFLLFRSLTSTDLEIEPEAVDYLATVELAQDAQVTIAYPPTLPKGWIATNVTVVPGERPEFGLSILTDSGTFAGIRQEDTSLEALLKTYVDEETTAGEPLEVDAALDSTWESFSDDGGDLAYASEVGEDTLLVYGSASAADLRTLIELLTTETLSP